MTQSKTSPKKTGEKKTKQEKDQTVQATGDENPVSQPQVVQPPPDRKEDAEKKPAALGAPGSVVDGLQPDSELEQVVQDCARFRGAAVVIVRSEGDKARVERLVTGSKYPRRVKINPNQEPRAIWRTS